MFQCHYALTMNQKFTATMFVAGQKLVVVLALNLNEIVEKKTAGLSL